MLDPTPTGFENWPSHDEPASSGAGGILSTIMPIVFGLFVGVGIGAWYIAKPAATSKEARTAKVAEQMSSYIRSFGDKPRKGRRYRETFDGQAEESNRALQRLQNDLQEQMNNSWRPGG